MHLRRVSFITLLFLGLVGLSAMAYASKTVVVFPFDNNTKNPTMEWIGDSFVETLNDQLATSILNPFSLDQRNAAYDLLGLPYDGDFSRATMIKVAEELDADYIVFGSYRYDNMEFSTTAQLVSLEPPRLEGEFTEKGPLDSLKRIQNRLAWRILTHFDSTFPYSQEDFYKRSGEVPLSAFENYVRGRRALDSKSQLQFFLNAERLDPSYTKAIFQIGKAYFQQKDYATSQLWLRRITKGERHFYEATFYLGLDYFFLGSFERAASQFTLLSLDVPLNEVFNNLAASLSRLGDSNQVVHNYRMAIDGDPGEPDFYFNLGYYYWKAKDNASAVKYLREALQLNPGDAEASFLLGNALQSMKQPEESAQYLKMALRLNPKIGAWSPAALPALERVKSNYDAEAFRELKETLDHLYEQKLKSRSVSEQISERLKAGREFFNDGRDEEALKAFDAALSLNDKQSEAYLYRGRIFERQGKFNDAIREMKLALEVSHSCEAHLALAHLYYTLDRRDDARREVEAALAVEPANPAAHEMKSLLQQGATVTKK